MPCLDCKEALLKNLSSQRFYWKYLQLIMVLLRCYIFRVAMTTRIYNVQEWILLCIISLYLSALTFNYRFWKINYTGLLPSFWFFLFHAHPILGTKSILILLKSGRQSKTTIRTSTISRILGLPYTSQDEKREISYSHPLKIMEIIGRR